MGPDFNRNRKNVRLFNTLVTLGMLLFFFGTSFANDLEQAVELMEEGWWDDAELQLESLLAEHPNDAGVCHQLAELYVWRMGNGEDVDWGKAQKYAKKAIDLNGSEASYYITLASCLGIQAREGNKLRAPGRAKDARKACEKAVELNPDDIDARWWLIDFHINAPGFAGGDKSEAGKHAAEIARIDKMQGHHAMARAYEFADKDIGKAEAELQKAVDEQPGESEPKFWYASFLSRQKRFEEAESVFRSVAEVDSVKTDALLQLAGMYQGMEEWEKAIEEYNTVLADDPANQSALMGLGYLYQSQEKWGEAVAEFEKAFAADSEYKAAIYQIGRTYLFSESNLDLAQESFQEYLAQPRLKGYWPSRAWGHYRLAMVYELKDEYKLAKAELRKALELNSKHKESKKLLRKLKRR